jgi:hypothetical protein
MTDEQKTLGRIALDAHVEKLLTYDASAINHGTIMEAWEYAAEAVCAPLLQDIASLQEKLRIREEWIAKLEERLEIDYVYMMDPSNEDGLIRVEVAPEDRCHQIDGISARDSTISLLEDRIRELTDGGWG